MSRPKAEPEGEPLAPLWILSFGDMITNFLAFFILIQSFSASQRAELLKVGDGPSGMAPSPMTGSANWLFGKRPEADFGHRQRKYAVESDPNGDSRERIIDAEDEQLRKIYDDLRRQSHASSFAHASDRVRLFTTPIRFPSGQATLDIQTLDFLTDLGSEIEHAAGQAEQTICVIGTAPDVAPGCDRYVLSSTRAQAVRQALAGNLPPQVTGNGSRLLAWGLGTGADSPGRSAADPEPCIVIAILESDSQE
jgi:flagellar motor protein MotB